MDSHTVSSEKGGRWMGNWILILEWPKIACESRMTCSDREYSYFQRWNLGKFATFDQGTWLCVCVCVGGGGGGTHSVWQCGRRGVCMRSRGVAEG